MSPRTNQPQMFVFPTQLGWMALAWRGAALVRTTFGHPSAAAATAHLTHDADWPEADRRDLPAWVADLTERMQGYAAGDEVLLDDVPLDLSHLTAFQQKVVRACRKIPRGRTRSYGELAAAIGSPGAARAVGTVMAKNGLPIIVPCHRVVGSAGALGGFSAPDGLSMKQRMLALEGAAPQAARPKKKVAGIRLLTGR